MNTTPLSPNKDIAAAVVTAMTNAAGQGRSKTEACSPW
jgi:hypothetical protein